MKITRVSPFSGKENTKEIGVTQEQINWWKGGALIQDAMPMLTPSEREFIMTGITDDEWNTTFGED